jgi:hypothetical protein
LDILDDNGGILDYVSVSITYEIRVNYDQYIGKVDAVPIAWLCEIRRTTTLRWEYNQLYMKIGKSLLHDALDDKEEDMEKKKA